MFEFSGDGDGDIGLTHADFVAEQRSVEAVYRHLQALHRRPLVWMKGY